MKKIIGILSVFLFPVVSFAQNYVYRMMDYTNGGYSHSGFESYSSLWLLTPLFIFPIIGACFAIAMFVFWIMMLVDAIKNSPEKTKIVWVLVIIFTHIIGALIYYFVEKRHRHHTEEKKAE